MKKTKTDKKVIGNYKAKFKTTFKKEESEFIFLNISISKDLQKLLKSIVVLEENKNFEYNSGEEYENYTRYLVKTWVYSSLYSRNREFLFEKNLIDKNELSIKIAEVGKIDTLIADFKECFRRLIEVVLKYSKIDVSVNFNIEKKQDDE